MRQSKLYRDGLRIAIVGDHQIPFHDTKAIRCAREVMRDFAPHKIVNVGDYYDFPDLSIKFSRTPEFKQQLLMAKRSGQSIMEKDLTATGLSPDSYTYIEGNHEARLRTFIQNRADALWELTKDQGVLSLPTLMGVPKGVTYVEPYGSTLEISFGGGGVFLARHGNRHNAYAAAAELRDTHHSGVSGHTHRIQNAFENGWNSFNGWWSNGCLCNIEGTNTPPDRFTGASFLRNWQQGITLLDLSKDRKLFDAHTIVIHNGRARYQGKDYIDRGGK